MRVRFGFFLAVLAITGCKDPDPAPATTSAVGSSERPVIEPATRHGSDRAAIEYSLAFKDAHKHLVDVTMTFEASGEDVELMLAVWTPGSYLVREYARQLEGIEAVGPNGSPLSLQKIRKNRWLLSAPTGVVTVRYRIYAREMSVRTNFVDDEVAMIVGAATFLTVVGRENQRHDVSIELRPGWKQAVTGLDPIASGAGGDAAGAANVRFVAQDFDELVDSPFVIGSPTDSEFDAGGKTHRLATFAEGPTWDAEKSAEDVAKIVRELQAFWGSIPYEKYVFINPLIGGRGMGGLEHLDSTLLLANPNLMAKKSRYRSWLSLVAHEFFHTWNGKRLRPRGLGPFDYENEVYTEDLWIVEGLTSYYDDLILARTKLYSEKQYLDALGGQIASIQRTPGRSVQPLSLASFDAWIKYYRRDENSSNTSISYYTKGSVVGFLLDMAIRRASGASQSLDDVMRLAYRRHGSERPYTSAEFEAIASEVAGVDLSSFFDSAIRSTDELDYDSALDYVGLRFAPVKEDDGKAKDPKASYFGVSTSGTKVTRVTRDSPAFEAGINVDDELIAIAGERVSAELSGVLARHKPGAKVEVLVARRNKMRTLTVTLAEPLEKRFELEKVPKQTSAQAARFAEWQRSQGN